MTPVNALQKAVGALHAARKAAHHAADESVAMRDSVLPAMATVREACDALEREVASDLWPLPSYREMLFAR